MKKNTIYLLLLLMISCNKVYKEISNKEFQKMSIQDTLVENSKVLVFKVGDSISDEYSKLLVKSMSQKKYYLFEYDCKLENDSIIHSFYPAFVIDEEGEFRKNGIWVYAQFYSEGTFPFNKNGIKFTPMAQEYKRNR
jgi:hypothetical protein